MLFADDVPDDAWGRSTFRRVSESDHLIVFYEMAQALVVKARREIAACSSSDAKRLRTEMVKVDRAVIQDITTYLMGQPANSPALLCLILVEGRHLAADALSLLSRLAGGRDGLTLDIADCFQVNEDRRTHRLNVVVDLLNVLAVCLQWAVHGFNMLMAECSMDTSRSRPHFQGVIVSMLSAASPCETLEAYMALSDVPCILHGDVVATITNAAAGTTATLLHLAASCKAAYNVVSSSAGLHNVMARVVQRIDLGKGSCQTTAFQLAVAVSASLHAGFVMLHPTECGAEDMLSHWSRHPDVLRVLLNTLASDDSAQCSGDRSSQGAAGSSAEPPLPNYTMYKSLYDVVVSSYWTLTPAQAGHIAALRAAATRLPQTVYDRGRCQLCRLAVALLPRVLPPAAQPRAFLDVCEVVQAAAAQDPGNEGTLTEATTLIVRDMGNLVHAELPPAVLFFRARCILSRGLLASCEDLARRTWEARAGHQRNERRRAPDYVNRETETADELWRLALRVVTLVSRDRDVAATGVAATLSIAATVRKVLCCAARVAAAMRQRRQFIDENIDPDFDDDEGLDEGRGSAADGQRAAAEATQHFSVTPGAADASYTRSEQEVLQQFEPACARLLEVVTVLPPCFLNSKLVALLAVQLLPPTLHMLRLLHPSNRPGQQRLLLVLLGVLPNLHHCGLELDSTLGIEVVDLLGEVLSAMAGPRGLLAVNRELREQLYLALSRSLFVPSATSIELQPWLLRFVTGRPLRSQLLDLLRGAQYAEWLNRRVSSVGDLGRIVTVDSLSRALQAPSTDAPAATADSLSWDALALRASVSVEGRRGAFLGCWCRGCSNCQSRTEAELRLLTCGGCNVARYCSPACQRRAWRAGHRAACQRYCPRE